MLCRYRTPVRLRVIDLAEVVKSQSWLLAQAPRRSAFCPARGALPDGSFARWSCATPRRRVTALDLA